MSLIYSMVPSVDKNKLVKIEAKLNRGIPRVSVVGMPDSLSKKILLKVKSAILNQGFQWSLRRHLVISIDPPLVHKDQSSFLDLSFAVAILQEFKQLKIKSDKKVVAMGALNLKGEIQRINLEEHGFSPREEEVWFGDLESFRASSIELINIKNISHLNNISVNPIKLLKEKTQFKMYSKKILNLSPNWIRLTEVLIHGEHSCLFLMPDNSEIKDFINLVRDSLNSLDQNLSEGVRFVGGERPFVLINSSVSRGQILGTSGQGFYHHAHGGLAYLDNFCALGKSVRAAVKTKIEGGGLSTGEKTNAILFARNPLCPCGKARLGKPRKCGFSLYRCRSVLEKFSVDEFSLFQVVQAPVNSFFDVYPHPEVDFKNLERRKETAYALQRKRGQTAPNSKLDLFTLRDMMSEEAKTLAYIPVVNGLDRTQAILSVSRTLADLAGSLEIERDHVEEALVLSYKAAKEISKAF